MLNSQLSTPSHSRMAKISEKLNGMNLKFDQERVYKLDQQETRLRTLDDRYTDFVENLGNKNNNLREQLQKLQRTAEEEKAIRDTQLENKVKEVMQIEQKYGYLIEQEIRARKESEHKYGKLIEEKSNNLKMEVLRGSKIRAEETESLANAVQNDVGRISEALYTELKDREDADNKQVKRLNEDLNEISGEMQTEKRSREENEQAIFDMLRDVIERVKKEIDNERKEREDTEETLQNLLEDCTTKLNNISTG